MRTGKIRVAVLTLIMLVCANVFAGHKAAEELIKRVIPDHADKFVTEVIPADEGKDVFEIESRDDKIVLRGNNGISISSALYWYLKYYCHCHVSWCGDNLNLPDPLPVLEEKIRKRSPMKYRYAFNYCTFGYTMAFWDWERWEREIDFMALHGINTPLAMTGAEVVYRNVYRKLGLPDKDIDAFIAGPPFLPWFLMNNIDGWGGPNPDSWYRRQEELQKKIVARERELGMKPVLHGFTGHVPRAIRKKYPEAKLTDLRPWGGFEQGVMLLKPEDPLFVKLGRMFVRENVKLYGTSHIYSADIFNEVDPRSGDPEYLKNISAKVYNAMAAEDPEATWFMQGWLFMHGKKFWSVPRINAFLSGVPDDKIVILDLFSDAKPQWQRTKAFCGKPWLYGVINNWGGKQGMYGRLSKTGVEIPELMADPNTGKLSGIGTFNEGLDNNPIVYEQVYEMAWHDKPMDVEKWVADYVHARYGKDNANAQAAWKILHKQLYECKDKRHGPPGSYFAMVPTLNAGGSTFARATIFYDPPEIRKALKLLLAAADELGDMDTYRFDLVDVARQVMSDVSQLKLHAELRAAKASGNSQRYDRAKQAWYDAMLDCDRLLRTHRKFQLGRYLKYPRKAGTTEAEKRKWEHNARMLITNWGGRLNGYAQRQYGGLMKDFNLPVWKAYLSQGERAARQVMFDWINNPKHYKEYSVEAEGDAVEVVQKIVAKYCPEAGVSSEESARFVGRWEYEVSGDTYVREFMEDGTLNFYKNGKKQSSWNGFTWMYEDGTAYARQANGAVFERHRLKDPQTLEFMDSKYPPAIREIKHIE